jgi:hypothetical protein
MNVKLCSGICWEAKEKPSELLSGLPLSWPRYEAKTSEICSVENTHLTAMFVSLVSLGKIYSFN